MKTILVIDPVVVEAWGTEQRQQYDEYVERAKGPETIVETVSIVRGPASIETFYDKAFAVPEVLRAIEGRSADYDAIMINCFVDPGVRAVREITSAPVVGAAEASMAMALLLGEKFGVISIGESASQRTELQARAMGIAGRLAGAVGIAISVLELEEDRDETARQLILAANKLIDERGASVIVLGCTGMALVADSVRCALPVPLIEPMAAALKMAETFAELGLHHAQTGLYAPPDKSKLVV